jgi:la-related protein 1
MGDLRQARETIERCCQEVPQKQMSMALLEYAKYFEMVDQVDRARLVMSQAKHLVKAEWKLYFEAVMLEFRQGNFKEAETLVTESLEVHFATGRLWATLIQMQHARAKTVDDFDLVNETFIKALNEIPKSGEVWCEGARLTMSRHPNNKFYDVEKAHDYLEFAL